MSSFPHLTGPFGNEPFGSRPEPGAYVLTSILLLPPGEVPEGRAGTLAFPLRPARERDPRPVRERALPNDPIQEPLNFRTVLSQEDR